MNADIAALRATALVAVITAFVLALVATWALGWIALRSGILRRITRRAPQDDERGLPRVGGAALALALAAAFVVAGDSFAASVAPESLASYLHRAFGVQLDLAPIAALAAAFAVGLLDDLLPRGLSALQKFGGQFVAGALLVAPSWTNAFSDPHVLELSLALIAFAVAAQNAINTFDNADGAAGSIVALALWAPAPIWAAPLGGFLVWNLPAKRVSHAILGDSGSHLLAMLVVLAPAAWPVLALPLFDLARVAVLRVREGRAPWRGDRSHLAHRLERAGFGSARVLAHLVVIAAPSIVLGFVGARAERADLVVQGILLTAALFVVALIRLERLERSARRRAELGAQVE